MTPAKETFCATPNAFVERGAARRPITVGFDSDPKEAGLSLPDPIPLEPVDNPPIFPEFVSCRSALLQAADHRAYFAAGRRCAALAIAGLGEQPSDVGRGAAGEPLWPAGVCGSITHKGDYVSAAVARTSDVRSLGIDAEEIVDDARADRIGRIVMLPREQSVGGTSLSGALRVSIVFSVKEALFKCLYPMAQRRFYFDAIALTDVDVNARRFEAVLLTDLAERFDRGRVLTGSVAVIGRRVHAGAWIAASPPADHFAP